MRVYVPATLPMLAQAVRLGRLPAAPTAHAVTPALREWYVEGDVEELEYAALMEAAQECLRLLAADPAAPRRRLVVAADVEVALATSSELGEPDAERAQSPRSRVLLPGPVELLHVVSLHVDDDVAVTDVAAAVAALEAADAGDDDAQFAVESAQGHDLLWYDVSELDQLAGDS